MVTRYFDTERQAENAKSINQQKIIDGQFKEMPSLKLEKEDKPIILAGLISMCILNNIHFLKTNDL